MSNEKVSAIPAINPSLKTVFDQLNNLQHEPPVEIAASPNDTKLDTLASNIMKSAGTLVVLNDVGTSPLAANAQMAFSRSQNLIQNIQAATQNRPLTKPVVVISPIIPTSPPAAAQQTQPTPISWACYVFLPANYQAPFSTADKQLEQKENQVGTFYYFDANSDETTAPKHAELFYKMLTRQRTDVVVIGNEQIVALGTPSLFPNAQFQNKSRKLQLTPNDSLAWTLYAATMTILTGNMDFLQTIPESDAQINAQLHATWQSLPALLAPKSVEQPKSLEEKSLAVSTPPLPQYTPEMSRSVLNAYGIRSGAHEARGTDEEKFETFVDVCPINNLPNLYLTKTMAYLHHTKEKTGSQRVCFFSADNNNNPLAIIFELSGLDIVKAKRVRELLIPPLAEMPKAEKDKRTQDKVDLIKQLYTTVRCVVVGHNVDSIKTAITQQLIPNIFSIPTPVTVETVPLPPANLSIAVTEVSLRVLQKGMTDLPALTSTLPDTNKLYAEHQKKCAEVSLQKQIEDLLKKLEEIQPDSLREQLREQITIFCKYLFLENQRLKQRVITPAELARKNQVFAMKFEKQQLVESLKQLPVATLTELLNLSDRPQELSTWLESFRQQQVSANNNWEAPLKTHLYDLNLHLVPQTMNEEKSSSADADKTPTLPAYAPTTILTVINAFITPLSQDKTPADDKESETKDDVDVSDEKEEKNEDTTLVCSPDNLTETTCLQEVLRCFLNKKSTVGNLRLGILVKFNDDPLAFTFELSGWSASKAKELQTLVEQQSLNTPEKLMANNDAIALAKQLYSNAHCTVIRRDAGVEVPTLRFAQQMIAPVCATAGQVELVSLPAKNFSVALTHAMITTLKPANKDETQPQPAPEKRLQLVTPHAPHIFRAIHREQCINALLKKIESAPLHHQELVKFCKGFILASRLPHISPEALKTLSYEQAATLLANHNQNKSFAYQTEFNDTQLAEFLKQLDIEALAKMLQLSTTPRELLSHLSHLVKNQQASLDHWETQLKFRQFELQCSLQRVWYETQKVGKFLFDISPLGTTYYVSQLIEAVVKKRLPPTIPAPATENTEQKTTPQLSWPERSYQLPRQLFTSQKSLYFLQYSGIAGVVLLEAYFTYTGSWYGLVRLMGVSTSATALRKILRPTIVDDKEAMIHTPQHLSVLFLSNPAAAYQCTSFTVGILETVITRNYKYAVKTAAGLTGSTIAKHLALTHIMDIPPPETMKEAITTPLLLNEEQTLILLGVSMLGDMAGRWGVDYVCPEPLTEAQVVKNLANGLEAREKRGEISNPRIIEATEMTAKTFDNVDSPDGVDAFDIRRAEEPSFLEAWRKSHPSKDVRMTWVGRSGFFYSKRCHIEQDKNSWFKNIKTDCDKPTATPPAGYTPRPTNTTMDPHETPRGWYEQHFGLNPMR